MAVLRPEPVLTDTDIARGQIHVFPVEAERFPLAKADRQGDDPSGTVAELRGFDQEALNLFDGVRLDVLLFEPRSFGDLRRVGGYVAAPYGLTDAPGWHRPDLSPGCRGDDQDPQPGRSDRQAAGVHDRPVRDEDPDD